MLLFITERFIASFIVTFILFLFYFCVLITSGAIKGGRKQKMTKRAI
jgi:hypothetical protein